MRVRLAEIAEVKLGRQRSPKNHTGDSMRPYLRAANVGWGGLQLSDVKEMNFTDAEMRTFRLTPGDLLLSEASGSPGEVGKPALWSGEIADCAFQNTLLRVRPGRSADPKYLLHFFRHEALSGAFAKGSRGVGIHHIGREALASWPVPLPPLDDQRRIAAILDQADALRDKRRRSLSLLDKIYGTLFHTMFGEPETAIHTVPFGTIASLSGGRNLVADDSTSNSKFRVLKISAVTTGQYKPSESKPLPLGYTPPESHLVKPGDLLMSRANTTELVGAVAYVGATPTNLALPDKIWRFVWRDTRSVPLFYHALFQSPSVRRRISALATGSGGSMKNVSKAKLETLALPHIDFPDQLEFASKVSAINVQRDAATRALESLDELYANLQAQAFSGEL